MVDLLSQRHLLELPSDDQTSLVGLSNREIQQWTTAKSQETQKYLLRVHKLHNSLIPINRIPDELLVVIFKLVQDDLQGSSIKWLRVMFVCSTWRSAALSTANLWRKINVSKNIDFVAHCLQHSKRALVDVIALTVVMNVEAVLKMLSCHADRIHSFKWLLHPSNNITHFFSMLDFRMDRLQALEIRRQDPFRMQKRHSGPTHDQFPNLQSLILEGVSVTLMPSFCSHLRRLELHGPGPMPRPRLPVDAFLDVMRASPMLEHLTLSMCGPDIPEGYEGAENKVLLPNLQTFTMKRKMLDVAMCLRMLEFPSSTIVHLSCELGQDVEWEHLGTLDYVLLCKTKPLSFVMGIRSIILNVTYQDYELKAYRDSCELRRPPLYLKFHRRDGVPQNLSACFPGAVAALGTVFGSSRVSCLQLNGDIGHRVNWTALLSSLPFLRQLSLDSSAVPERHDTIEELLQVLRGPLEPERSDKVCPHLEELTLSHVEYTSDLVRWLSDFLQARAKQGMRLKRLSLACYMLHDKNMDDLYGDNSAGDSDLFGGFAGAVGTFTFGVIDPPPMPAHEDMWVDPEAW